MCSCDLHSIICCAFAIKFCWNQNINFLIHNSTIEIKLLSRYNEMKKTGKKSFVIQLGGNCKHNVKRNLFFRIYTRLILIIQFWCISKLRSILLPSWRWCCWCFDDINIIIIIMIKYSWNAHICTYATYTNTASQHHSIV